MSGRTAFGLDIRRYIKSNNRTQQQIDATIAPRRKKDARVAPSPRLPSGSGIQRWCTCFDCRTCLGDEIVKRLGRFNLIGKSPREIVAQFTDDFFSKPVEAKALWPRKYIYEHEMG